MDGDVAGGIAVAGGRCGRRSGRQYKTIKLYIM